ncbi:hypothetical protein KBH77_04635 [Patescibacteria group bacterium]|nr:hypothetical protein [Patescibacteria group bacterium]
MITIDEAIKDCDNYKRFYNIAVDCKNYIANKDEEERLIIFGQPKYIDYVHSGTVADKKYFSKRILCDKIMLFIKYSNFIKTSDNLMEVDRECPDLFELIVIMTSIISKNINEDEMKVINDIINALKNRYNMSEVHFDNDNEMGIFNWSLPFIYTFWITQDENGLIKISTNEAMQLLIHENFLLSIVQSEAIKYKQEMINREMSKSKVRK